MVEDALAHSQRGSYYSTNEDEEAVAALEAVAFFLDCARSSDPMWRWAIVALHSAAQGMMVAALKGTDGVGVLRDGDVKKKHTAWEKARKASAAGDAAAADAAQLEALFGASKLAEFHVLYKRVKEDAWMGQYATSRRFQPRATDDNCLTCLNGLRNEFIHFKPMPRFGTTSRSARCRREALKPGGHSDPAHSGIGRRWTGRFPAGGKRWRWDRRRPRRHPPWSGT